MRTIEVKVYKFDELSDSAKQKARKWYRDAGLDYDWWDSTYEDAEQIGLKIKSFDLGRGQDIEGIFDIPAAHVAQRIVENHGDQCDTYKTAQKFITDAQEVEKKFRDADGEVTDEDALNDAQDALDAVFLKALLKDYWVMLQKEYDYLYTDESVDKNIQANEYEFTEDGKRFCY